MENNTNPEPFTFSELYDLKVGAIRQATAARKSLQKLGQSHGRTAATTNAIARWTEVRDTYDALTDRVQQFIEVKLAENDKRDAQVCAHCGGEIERQPGVGWVLTEIGGTYDVCESNWLAGEERFGAHRLEVKS
jgi:hypothetical protein